MLLNVIPSAFLLARDCEGDGDRGGSNPISSPDDVIAEIKKDFGIGAYAPDPFKELQDELLGTVLNDPFDFSVSSSFGASESPYSFDQDPYDEVLFDGWYDSLEDGFEDDEFEQGRKKRSPNHYQYQFGDVFQANWYRKYLREDIRERTYEESSRDWYGDFRCHFRMPLAKVDDLVHMFLDKRWIHKIQCWT